MHDSQDTHCKINCVTSYFAMVHCMKVNFKQLTLNQAYCTVLYCTTSLTQCKYIPISVQYIDFINQHSTIIQSVCSSCLIFRPLSEALWIFSHNMDQDNASHAYDRHRLGLLTKKQNKNKSMLVVLQMNHDKSLLINILQHFKAMSGSQFVCSVWLFSLS